MPKIVDREKRRTEIVDAYLRVLARDGGRAGTSRAVAAELGVATGSLWHYFDDFDGVLAAAFRRVYENTTARIEERTAGMRGLPALEAAVREMLPLERVTEEEAAVVVTFWGRVATEPQMGETQAEVERRWGALLTGHAREAIDDGQLRGDTPVADLVATLLVLTAGQQVEYVVRTSIGAAARQWSLVEHALRPWRTAPASR
ncbi:TetR family transcriptional regulator C-terminal domain-containing protein [Herbiconiux sp. 11R-BC]|uniref:TetR/AcrR family transcriptional regulator n=1 Tax=Herbiconiux sp. 11R-BC TaxID=3111637 RepID=UPI003BFB8264